MLAAGAEDYLEKPVDHLELLMRVRNRSRRAECSSGKGTCRYLNAGMVTLDVANHVVQVGDRKAALTPSEFAILRCLLESPGRALDAETLLVKALGYPPRLGNPDILRTHVRRLRKKIEVDTLEPRLIINLPRVGYMVPEDVAI